MKKGVPHPRFYMLLATPAFILAFPLPPLPPAWLCYCLENLGLILRCPLFWFMRVTASRLGFPDCPSPLATQSTFSSGRTVFQLSLSPLSKPVLCAPGTHSHQSDLLSLQLVLKHLFFLVAPAETGIAPEPLLPLEPSPIAISQLFLSLFFFFR